MEQVSVCKSTDVAQIKKPLLQGYFYKQFELVTESSLFLYAAG